MLRVKYGWAGEGKFWALNNMIAQSENCRLDISKKYNKASIANDLDFNIKTLDEFLDYLNDDCNLIIKNGTTITTDIIQENFGKVSSKRQRNSEDYRNSQKSETDIKPSENIQSKVKESKVNKIYKKERFLEFVLLTKEEHTSLKIKLGRYLDDYIERLNNYIGSKGVRYKSHYHTILNWHRKDCKSSTKGDFNAE